MPSEICCLQRARTGTTGISSRDQSEFGAADWRWLSLPPSERMPGAVARLPSEAEDAYKASQNFERCRASKQRDQPAHSCCRFLPELSRAVAALHRPGHGNLRRLGVRPHLPNHGGSGDQRAIASYRKDVALPSHIAWHRKLFISNTCPRLDRSDPFGFQLATS